VESEGGVIPEGDGDVGELDEPPPPDADQLPPLPPGESAGDVPPDEPPPATIPVPPTPPAAPAEPPPEPQPPQPQIGTPTPATQPPVTAPPPPQAPGTVAPQPTAPESVAPLGQPPAPVPQPPVLAVPESQNAVVPRPEETTTAPRPSPARGSGRNEPGDSEAAHGRVEERNGSHGAGTSTSPVWPSTQVRALPAAPERSVTQVDVAATIESEPGRVSAAGAQTHLVRPGESLWSIASDRLGVGASATEIARYVDLLWMLNAERIATGDPDLVHSGTRLVLPRS
jgi:hypothetical protein